VQAGSGLRNVGKTTLFIQNNKVIDRKYELIPLASIRKTNPGVQALIDKYNSNVEFSKVIATTEALFSGEDEFGCMMTDAITHRMKVDFAFQNNGGIRISQLPAGNITLRDIYRLDPFGNQVVIFKMNAEEIKSLICNAFNKEKSIDLQASGMTYTVIKGADGKCADVIMNDLNGNPLDPGREYTVGVNSYISASYTFSHRDPGTSLAITAAQALIEYLMEVKSVNYAGKKRAFVQ
jgi:2',3'-cyclic-nucleotide 2'-phosphodiesterase (5'-nucleotidase family)